MQMQVHHLIVGYDRKTDEMKVQYPIPDALFRHVAALLPASDIDPAFRHSYPMDHSSVNDILVGHLGGPRASRDLDYFVESREPADSVRSRD